MSIPSARHTIYSFITLCLKEHRDIAGRKEIAATAGEGGREGKKNRMPSWQETYLCDRFIGKEPASILGPPLILFTHHPPSYPTWNEEDSIFWFISRAIRFTLAFIHALTHLHVEPEVTERTSTWGDSVVVFFFYILGSHEFLRPADASSYFLALLTTGLLSGLIRVQCSW